MNDMPRVPLRPRVLRYVIRGWPFRRGSHRIERLLLRGFEAWPESSDIDFRYGRFLGASLLEWPRGFRELYLHGVMEPAEVAMWRRVLRPGDTVIDGGANWGYWSLVAAELVGARGVVLAIEPVPTTAAALRRNLRASGRDGVVVIEAALAARSGETLTLNLFEGDPFAGASSAGSQGGRRTKGAVDVRTVSIDDLAAEHAVSPSFMKLDIEGGELYALRGASGVLRSDAPPVVSFEWNVIAADGLGYHPRQAIEFLNDFGLSPHVVMGDRLVPFVPRDPEWTPMVWCLRSDRGPGSRLRGVCQA